MLQRINSGNATSANIVEQQYNEHNYDDEDPFNMLANQ